MIVGDCEQCGQWAGTRRSGRCPSCIEKGLPRVIGIAGPAGAGKSKAAAYLVDLLPQYSKAAFADPIKSMLAEGLGLRPEQLYGDEKAVVDERYGCTPRHIMQTLGTEWGRRLIHPDVWVRALADRVAGRRVVIDDARFPDEAAFVRENGVLIHLVGRGGIEGGHVSEKQLDRLPGDKVVDNMGDPEQLYKGLEHALSI